MAFEGIRDLQKQSHAGIVLVSGEIISGSLRTALLTMMRPMNKEMTKRLFEGYGPLSTFAARTASPSSAAAKGLSRTSITAGRRSSSRRARSGWPAIRRGRQPRTRSRTCAVRHRL